MEELDDVAADPVRIGLHAEDAECTDDVAVAVLEDEDAVVGVRPSPDARPYEARVALDRDDDVDREAVPEPRDAWIVGRISRTPVRRVPPNGSTSGVSGRKDLATEGSLAAAADRRSGRTRVVTAPSASQPSRPNTSSARSLSTKP